MWILFSFLGPVFHSISNTLDSYLSNIIFKRKLALVFYPNLFGALFLPILFLFFGLPDALDLHYLPAYIILALVNVGYLYPYYKAFEASDTSIVVSLFALTGLFVPVLAYFFVGEILAPIQYVGVILIAGAAFLLGIKRGERMKITASFWWMLLCCFIIAFGSVLYKYVFLAERWITGFTWPTVISFVMVLLMLLFRNARQDLFDTNMKSKKILSLFAGNELAAFLGSAAGTYASSVGPVTVVSIIAEIQPMLVLLWAKIFRSHAPDFFREQVDKGSILRKGLLFVIVIIGITLTIWGK